MKRAAGMTPHTYLQPQTEEGETHRKGEKGQTQAKQFDDNRAVSSKGI